MNAPTSKSKEGILEYSRFLQRLKPDDSFFLAFFANCPIGLNLCRMDGRWVQSYPAFLNIIGYTAEEADDNNLTYWELTPPEYDSDEEVQLKNLKENGTYGPYTKEFIRKDGNRIPVRLNGFLIERAGEQFIWSMIEDLSAQTHLREELTQSESFYQAILDNLPVAVFAKDSKNDWKYVIWNHLAQETIDLKKETVLGKTDFDLFPKQQAEIFREIDEKALRSQEKIDISAEKIHLPGQPEKWLQTCKVAFNDAKGNPRYLLGITQDITKRKETEDSLKEAVEAAHKASLAKSEFLSNMSHEIRTPLHAMLGVGELLAKTKLDETQTKYLQIMAKSGARLLEVVNDVLDLERIESGQVKIKHNAEKLAGILNSVYELMLVPAQKANLKFNRDIQVPADLVVCTDAGILHQILTNIIGNSIKFTPANGSIEMLAQWKANEKYAAGQLTVIVRDTGIGISKENQLHVFEPFRQGDQSVGKKYGGSGLGLAIVAKLVTNLNGEINLESELNKGTSITMKFPIDIAPPEMIKIVESKKKPKEPSKITEKSKILVVDDSPDNQMLACEILRANNYDVVMANDGYEALEVFGSTHPDLVLLDIGMPVMDGYETVRRLRKREQELNWSPIPIVALTGYALKTDVERATAAGFNKHLAKPFGMAQLLNVVSEMLTD